MKFSFEIRPEQRAIFARYEGKFTYEDLLATTRQLWADPRYSSEYDGLVDLSAGSLSVDMNDLRALTEFLVREPATSSGRWAAVAASPLAIACGLVYRSAMKRRHAFEVFTTWEAACGFLKLDPAAFPQDKHPDWNN
jgi:hypothetical protein